MPPNGRSVVVQVGWLMNTMPVSMRLATRLPRATFLVKTEPPNPKSESLASATASVFVFDPEQKGDRPEEFLPKGGITGFDIRQDRRLHEGAESIDAFAPHHQGSAVGDGSFDLVQQLHQGRFRG